MIISVHCNYCIRFAYGDGCIIFKLMHKLLENLRSLGGVLLVKLLVPSLFLRYF